MALPMSQVCRCSKCSNKLLFDRRAVFCAWSVLVKNEKCTRMSPCVRARDADESDDSCQQDEIPALVDPDQADAEHMMSDGIQPEKFREHVKKMPMWMKSIVMFDKMPMWMKLAPGRQLHLPGEFAVSKTKLKADEKIHAMRHGGCGGSQSVANQFSDGIDNEGMIQTRQPSNSEQDKFRITVDVEHVCHGFFDSEGKTPWPDNGITSVVFTGARFSLANASTDRCWKEDDVYVADGKDKACEAGQP